MKIFKKIYIILIIISSIRLNAEYRLSSECYLHFSDSLNLTQNLSFDEIIPNVQIPEHLFNYTKIKKEKFANYYLTFKWDSDFFNSKDSLFLVIKSIGSADKTFLNGKKIGETGKFPPNFLSEYGKERIYYIPKTLLQNQNILKMIIYSPQNTGGILKESPIIYTINELKLIKNSHPIPIENILLPFSNGFTTANFNKKEINFNHFYPHIYSKYNKDKKTKLVLEKLTPEIYKNGLFINLNHIPAKTSYISGTGIINYQTKIENSNISIIGFCPFTENQPIWVFYLIIEKGDFKNFQGNFILQNPSKELQIYKDGFVSQNQKWIRLIIHHKNQTSNNFSLTKYKNLNNNFSIFRNELSWWKEWQKASNIPNNLSNDELNSYLQSLVLIKMAQSREDAPVKGQILSSLPPDYNHINLLDQTLIVDALIISQHYTEALNSLQFLLNSNCGKYRNFNLFGNNVGLLNKYCLSVNEYYSNGTEKEINPEHPIISLIGYGQILSNIRDYIEATNDQQFLEYYWEKIYREIALVIINLIDETGFIRSESGFFNEILPGKHYTYSSVAIYNGLIDVAWMARIMGQETAAKEFEFYGNKIRINIQNKLFDNENNIVRSSLEGRTKDKYIDATITSLTNNIFSSQDNISNATINTIEKYLSSKTSPLVYSKYSTHFLDKEVSTFLNFNLAETYYRINNKTKGNDIIEYMIKISKNNNFLFPVNINPIFNSYSGCISIKSHSAYIKAIHNRK